MRYIKYDARPWGAMLLAFSALACSGATGEPGPAGDDGKDGQDGNAAEAKDGADGKNGKDGADGKDGKDGTDGKDGVDSESLGETIVGAKPAIGRLAISDLSAPGVRILDLQTGQIAASFADIGQGAALYPTESGRIIAAAQGAVDESAGRVDFIDSGLILNADGARTRELPNMLGYSLVADDLDTANPVHFVSHGGYITMHFDGVWSEESSVAVDAANYIFKETDLLSTDITPLELRSESQHGVSVVSMVDAMGHVILTAPSLSRDVSTLPSGFTIHELKDGTLLQTIQDEAKFEESCIGMHGEAAVGHSYLFGCHERFDGGILVLEYDEVKGEYISRKIRYPDFDIDSDPRAPARTSVMRSHPKSPYALGQYGHYTGGNFYTGLIRIDPTKAQLEMQDTLDFGSVYCAFDFEQQSGKLAVALTMDGRFHVAEINGWKDHKTLQLLSDGNGTCPGYMAVGEGVAYVAPAGEGVIYEVELTSLEVARVFDVGGDPGSLALASFRLALE